MSSVRPATILDLQRIIDMMHVFNDQYFKIPLNEDKCEVMVSYMITEGIVFVSDYGFIGGIVTEDLFRDWTYLGELGWYATDRSGLSLLKAFIHAGKEAGVDEIRMCTLDTSPESARKVLIKKGFIPVETSYRLIINE